MSHARFTRLAVEVLALALSPTLLACGSDTSGGAPGASIDAGAEDDAQTKPDAPAGDADRDLGTDPADPEQWFGLITAGNEQKSAYTTYYNLAHPVP